MQAFAGERALIAGTTPKSTDVPMLKPTVWTNEISTYMFLGGLSGGALLLARVIEMAGGQRYRGVVRRATYLSLGAALPCAPLLIDDLGVRSRFHHMLRVWKPSSPMNLGAWTLTAHTGAAALASLREWLHAHGEEQVAPTLMTRLVPLALDTGSLSFALVLICYTGVLVSGAATPVWCRNPWLAPLFAASAMSSAAQGVSLLEAAATGEPSSPLHAVRTAASVTEAVLLTGYVHSVKRRGVGEALTRGKAARYLWGARAGLVLSEALAHAPLPPRARRWARIASGVVGLAAGMAVRQAVLEAGRASGKDRRAQELATTPTRRTEGVTAGKGTRQLATRPVQAPGTLAAGTGTVGTRATPSRPFQEAPSC